jgi:hypothetical protein
MGDLLPPVCMGTSIRRAECFREQPQALDNLDGGSKISREIPAEQKERPGIRVRDKMDKVVVR